MNLDDLMEVWRSQDVSPLHGVNEALLRLALREEEVKAQNWRRRGRWIFYGATALSLGFLARFFFIMIYRTGHGVLSVWDYAIPVVGGAAALLSARRVYARQRAQAVREQRFGDSLRDQISRQLAQLDDTATRVHLASRAGMRLLPMVCAFAIILASWRVHGRSFSDPRLLIPIVLMIGWIVIMAGGTSWASRRWVQRRMLPRKRRLEELLKELDAP